MPAVSVILVFHRDQPFLRPAIASVLGQTMRDLELVLVDNGTGLPATALGELGADPRVRWVRLSSNEGIPAGHNAGVAAATAPLIALHDYDDVSLPKRLEGQVAALARDPSVGFVSGLAETIDAQGRVLGRVFCLADPAEHLVYSQFAAVAVTPAGMGRREVFERWRYRAEFPFAADLDFQARFVEAGRILVLPEVVLRYRWYGAQTTQAWSESIERSRCAIQLITARRRAGRPEQLPATLAELKGTSAAEAWRRGARRCLAEGFAALAAYQARRSLAFDRRPGAAMAAGKIALQAWRRAGPNVRLLAARLFFRGPVRAYGLRQA